MPAGKSSDKQELVDLEGFLARKQIKITTWMELHSIHSLADLEAFLKDKRIDMYSNYMTLYISELDRYRQDFIEPAKQTDEVIKK